jgi:hypothetical protein
LERVKFSEKLGKTGENNEIWVAALTYPILELL